MNSSEEMLEKLSLEAKTLAVVVLRLTAPQRLGRPAGRMWELKYDGD